MYPEADIPCVQLSLINNLEPLAHIKLGRALQGMADSSILLIGSGFSFHNMKAFFTPDSDESMLANKTFEQWLLETCSDNSISEDERTERLVRWESAPSARYCHPREEHLLPLHVCYGFAESASSKSYKLQILNKDSSMYLWENES
jgi:aromatic ring-opening dioxygenase catalytic subunit (LigB family)